MSKKVNGKWVRVQASRIDKRPAFTNRNFANTDEAFNACCADANVHPTVRQASKFRNGYGAAYRVKAYAKTS